MANDPYLEIRHHGPVMRVRRWRAVHAARKHRGGRWDAKAEKAVLNYLWRRDHNKCGGKCGLRFRGPVSVSIERVIPSGFGLFDLEDSKRGPKAKPGETWRSLENHPNNLQAVHTDGCKKRDTPFVTNWRHPKRDPLLVAVRAKGQGSRYMWVPREPAS